MKKNLTELIFIPDRNGSMAGIEDNTVGGVENARRAHSYEKLGMIPRECAYTCLYHIWRGACL